MRAEELPFIKKPRFRGLKSGLQQIWSGGILAHSACR
jgi:hypothetical protein